MLTDRLDHLPAVKRRELTHVIKVLFEEFEAQISKKASPHKQSGRILKVILFGSMARGDWVDDRISGYKSDFDLLIVVSHRDFTDLHEYWDLADERLIRDLTVTHRIRTPVNFIVYSLDEVNDQLARGRPFFSDIARDGIMLYEAAGHPLAKAKALSSEEVKTEAKGYYDHWYKLMQDAFAFAEFGIASNKTRDAAFMLHQTVERAYHCVLLTLTLYSPKSHRINVLRSQAEALDDRLLPIWPRNTRFAKRSFARLQRAYVDARYSPEYEITNEELAWLVERVKLLQEAVKQICEAKIGV
ncbi:HEPN domain-containing protein [Asticcacaulis sp. 201]|uniref:HEPN domain-containing protein n=1 Tax=Asticcacaulis sp. 201 TaxID=3028787 RepID=UPI002916BD11|nr:HEPN domain-containing protein [Asticcacaulis sp. 201]MDV6333230.1 HEPN domain-containing protein [Asticcacaulis sp. 201]